MDVCSFIKAVLAQDENTIRSFFHKEAYVNWHCSKADRAVSTDTVDCRWKL